MATAAQKTLGPGLKTGMSAIKSNINEWNQPDQIIENGDDCGIYSMSEVESHYFAPANYCHVEIQAQD